MKGVHGESKEKTAHSPLTMFSSDRLQASEVLLPGTESTVSVGPDGVAGVGRADKREIFLYLQKKKLAFLPVASTLFVQHGYN